MEPAQAAPRGAISFFMRLHAEEIDLDHEKIMDVIKRTIEIQPFNCETGVLPLAQKTKILRFGEISQKILKIELKDLCTLKILKNTYLQQSCKVRWDGLQQVALFENKEEYFMKFVAAKRTETLFPVEQDIEFEENQLYCLDIYPTQMRYQFSHAVQVDEQETPLGINKQEVEKFEDIEDEEDAGDFVFECADRHAEKGQVKEVLFWFDQLEDSADAILKHVQSQLYDPIRADKHFHEYIKIVEWHCNDV